MDENNVININDNIITDDQISTVYNTLNEISNDNSTELLNAAHEETENTEYSEVTEINDIDVDDDAMPSIEDIPEVVVRDVIRENIKDINGLNMNDEEAESLIDLLVEYNKDRSIKIYDKLPKMLQDIIHNYASKLNPLDRRYITTEDIAREYINNLLSDSELDAQIKYLNKEMNAAMADMEKELSSIMDEAYDGIFDSINQVKEENPEKAERIEKVKAAFDKASTWDTQLDFLKTQKPRDVRKYHLRFNDACNRFNTIVNVNLISIKVPEMQELYNILREWMPNYSKDQLKEFCVLICKSVENMDFNDIGPTAYVHKLTDNIYVFKHRHTASYFEYEDYFKSIGDVITAIEDYKKSNKGVK